MANKKGFNDYFIDEDKVTIYIYNKLGEKFETYIDIEDLNNVIESGLHFNCTFYNKVNEYYASATQYLGIIDGKPRYKNILLHKFISRTIGNGCNANIDHIDHNTLDNRKFNLRISSGSNNSKNRKELNSNNKSGYRNVCDAYGWWIVQLQIEGKNKILGKFKNMDEAGIFAKQMRKKYYGEFAGNG